MWWKNVIQSIQNSLLICMARISDMIAGAFLFDCATLFGTNRGDNNDGRADPCVVLGVVHGNGCQHIIDPDVFLVIPTELGIPQGYHQVGTRQVNFSDLFRKRAVQLHLRAPGPWG